MRITAAVIVAALFFPIGSSHSITAQQSWPEFSGDMVDNETGANTRIYVGKSRVRLEAAGAGIVILDPVQGRGWVLMPQSHTYAGITDWSKSLAPLLRLADPSQPCMEFTQLARQSSKNGAVTCKSLGPDTTNGRATEKWEGHAVGETAYFWVDPVLDCIMKFQSGGVAFELKNIKEGAQPAALFEIPATCKRVEIGQSVVRPSPPH